MVEMVFEKQTKAQTIRETLRTAKIAVEYIAENVHRGTIKIVFKEELSVANRQVVINLLKTHGLDFIEQKI